MKESQKFDLINSPLEGTNLIEASAGTGKTYTITGLFLRLVLEKNFSVDQILVVTFTEAATKELKDRIRTRLREATTAFSSGNSDDSTLNNLIHKYLNKNEVMKMLKEAIRDFDQAAIFTIHGFCRRMLYENAFESSSLFDTELIVDPEHLVQEIVADFWRKYFYNSSPLFINYALDKNISPASLFQILGTRISQTDLKVIPQIEIPDSSQQEKEYSEAFLKIQNAWAAARTEVENILLETEGLNRSKYKKTNIPLWFQSMDEFINSGGANPALFDKFEKFTQDEIENSVKDNHPAPVHPFFRLCKEFKAKYDDLEKVFEQRILGLKIKLFYFVREELQSRKDERNIQSFDDLLLKMHQALLGKGGEDLAKSIRKKFKAALIDEFQDTDPIQYSIFKNIFETEHNILFLIGDPKQAIYGFRGADIFAYMTAAKEAKTRFTLGKNWRAEQGLITAINTIFANTTMPFVYEEIPFEMVEAASAKKDLVFLDHQVDSPLQLWLVNASKITGSAKPLSKSLARERIAKVIAAEISRLLHLGRASKAFIGAEPIRESDIAVLVRRNDEATLMQKILAEYNIPGVLYSTVNIFDSDEAMELERILAGMAEPNNDRFIKAALATDLLGVKGDEIDQLIEHENEWEVWLIKFREYHDLWNRHGFIRMFRQFIEQEKVLPRVMAMPNGERRTTNLLHLAEILHKTSAEQKLTLVQLLTWLSAQRDPRAPRLEEYQLRLESDENAVKLVTIHKSKGLEYPIVFCPFNWDGSKLNRSTDHFLFHDQYDHFKLTIDFGSEHMETNRVLAEKEILAENLRLLYVALTRAKHRCYLVWGRFNEAESSALSYLFHQPGVMDRENIVAAIGEWFKTLNDTDIAIKLKTLVARSEGTIQLDEMPTEGGQVCSLFDKTMPRLFFKEFKGEIDHQWRITSFSSLVYRQPYSAELADHDVAAQTSVTDQMELESTISQEIISDFFSLPGGRMTGILLHKILENLDLTRHDSAYIENLVAEKINEYGYDSIWLGTICRMIQNVISIPLYPDQNHFTLSRVQNQHRLNEMEFYFPLQSISVKMLQKIFSKYAMTEFSTDFPERIEQLTFTPTRGFMKGFVDLIFQFEGKFYLVDWKTNLLGNKIEDYNQNSLRKAMGDNFYYLQYHIYIVALNQYLKLKIPDYNYGKDFGGVFYIFIRGLDPERGPESGIYRDRPAKELIETLSQELLISP